MEKRVSGAMRPDESSSSSNEPAAQSPAAQPSSSSLPARTVSGGGGGGGGTMFGQMGLDDSSSEDSPSSSSSPRPPSSAAPPLLSTQPSQPHRGAGANAMTPAVVSSRDDDASDSGETGRDGVHDMPQRAEVREEKERRASKASDARVMGMMPSSLSSGTSASTAAASVSSSSPDRRADDSAVLLARAQALLHGAQRPQQKEQEQQGRELAQAPRPIIGAMDIVPTSSSSSSSAVSSAGSASPLHAGVNHRGGSGSRNMGNSSRQRSAQSAMTLPSQAIISPAAEEKGARVTDSLPPTATTPLPVAECGNSKADDKGDGAEGETPDVPSREDHDPVAGTRKADATASHSSLASSPKVSAIMTTTFMGNHTALDGGGDADEELEKARQALLLVRSAGGPSSALSSSTSGGQAATATTPSDRYISQRPSNDERRAIVPRRQKEKEMEGDRAEDEEDGWNYGGRVKPMGHMMQVPTPTTSSSEGDVAAVVDASHGRGNVAPRRAVDDTKEESDRGADSDRERGVAEAERLGEERRRTHAEPPGRALVVDGSSPAPSTVSVLAHHVAPAVESSGGGPPPLPAVLAVSSDPVVDAAPREDGEEAAAVAVAQPDTLPPPRPAAHFVSQADQQRQTQPCLHALRSAKQRFLGGCAANPSLPNYPSVQPPVAQQQPVSSVWPPEVVADLVARVQQGQCDTQEVTDAVLHLSQAVPATAWPTPSHARQPQHPQPTPAASSSFSSALPVAGDTSNTIPTRSSGNNSALLVNETQVFPDSIHHHLPQQRSRLLPQLGERSLLGTRQTSTSTPHPHPLRQQQQQQKDSGEDSAERVRAVEKVVHTLQATVKDLARRLDEKEEAIAAASDSRKTVEMHLHDMKQRFAALERERVQTDRDARMSAARFRDMQHQLEELRNEQVKLRMLLTETQLQNAKLREAIVHGDSSESGAVFY